MKGEINLARMLQADLAASREPLKGLGEERHADADGILEEPFAAAWWNHWSKEKVQYEMP